MAARFWHSANLAFSEEERAEFNAWRARLYHTGDLLRDRLRLQQGSNGTEHVEQALALANDLMSKISNIPNFVL